MLRRAPDVVGRNTQGSRAPRGGGAGERPRCRDGGLPDDAVLISRQHGVLRGADVRTCFEHPNDPTGFGVLAVFIDDDVAFLTWKTDAVPFGSDTFVMRD